MHSVNVVRLRIRLKECSSLHGHEYLHEGEDAVTRWLWKPKWKEPPLLLAPISPNSRPDDMRMSLTIGACPAPVALDVHYCQACYGITMMPVMHVR